MNKLFQYPTILFLPIPFFHWMGALISLLYIMAILIISIIVRLRNNNTRINRLVFFSTFLTALYIAISLALFQGTYADWLRFGPSNQSFLLLQAVQFFILIIIVGLAGNIDREQYAQYITYFFIVLLATTFIEAFATNVLDIHPSVFPKYFEAESYNAPVIANYYRPFGLTGNAPMNATMLVVIMWIYTGLNKKSKMELIVHAVTFLALLVSYSGQAILIYFATLILYTFRQKMASLVIASALVIVTHFILSTEILGYKVSYAYILRVLQEMNFTGVMNQLSMTDVLFGALGNIPSSPDFSTEIYPIYSVSRFGIIITLIMWILILCHKTSRKIKIGLWAAVLGSLHYAAILLIELQLPIIIMLLSNKEYYEDDSANNYILTTNL